MKILILDDDDTRHRRFAQWFGGYEVDHTFTYAQFAQKYMAGKYDYVFLDHDLNDNAYASVSKTENRELTGLDAAKLVAEHPDHAEHAVVHSWNPEGAKYMLHTLRQANVPVTRWEFDPKEDLKLR